MQIFNREQGYGYVHIGLHWLIALALFVLFGLGLWMVDLGFYHPWYHDAPHWHKSLGVLVVGLMLLRATFKAVQPKVAPLTSHRPAERIAAKTLHAMFYWLVLALGVSGYLISTAKGQPLLIFNDIAIPAIPPFMTKQADVMGLWHFWIAVSLMALAALHALGALKHHFIDQDTTLKRMLKPNL